MIKKKIIITFHLNKFIFIFIIKVLKFPLCTTNIKTTVIKQLSRQVSV